MGETWRTQYDTTGKESALPPVGVYIFSELVAFLRRKYSKTDSDHCFTCSELVSLCSQCDSFEEFQELLKEEAREICLWDEVFSRFVGDKKKWTKLGKLLDEIVGIRNAVMHHRPVHIHYVSDLDKTDRLLQSIINKPVPTLSEEDRRKIRYGMKYMSSFLIQMAEMSRTIDSALKPTHNAMRCLAKSVMPITAQLGFVAETVGAIAKQQSDMFATIDPCIAESVRSFQLLKDLLDLTLLSTFSAQPQNLLKVKTRTEEDSPENNDGNELEGGDIESDRSNGRDRKDEV